MKLLSEIAPLEFDIHHFGTSSRFLFLQRNNKSPEIIFPGYVYADMISRICCTSLRFF